MPKISIIFLVIILWMLLTMLLNIPKYGLGSKRNMILTGVVGYLAVVTCIIVDGEDWAWVASIVLLFLIPTGYLASYLLNKIYIYIKTSKDLKNHDTSSKKNE
jgi:hypothetical protein